ncbi:TPA: hypothetical protein H1008_01810 [archaeon]|nr:hypothetical protein [Candidatus Undinarchaeales archaeon SRR5007147.bin71]
MGVRALLGGISKKIKSRFSDEDDLEDELGSDEDLDDDLSEDEEDEEEDLDDLNEKPEPSPTSPPSTKPPVSEIPLTPAPQEQKVSSAPHDSGKISAELATIKTKIDLLESHLQNIESKEALYKSEADRYMQYLTYISDKLDNLAREHAELERLIRQ